LKQFKGNVLVFSDSLLENLPLQSKTDQTKFTVYAFPGKTAYSVLNATDQDYFQVENDLATQFSACAACVICFGTSDLGYGELPTRAAEFVIQIEKRIRMCIGSNLKIITCLLLNLMSILKKIATKKKQMP
jgi:hypothetical protein